MKADTFRDLSADELEAKSSELREQLLKLRFQQSTGQIESPQMLRGVRKDIARVMTILRERELGLEPPGAPLQAEAPAAAEPAVGPAAEPAIGPAAEPAAGPAAEPAARPAAEPAARPAETQEATD